MAANSAYTLAFMFVLHADVGHAPHDGMDFIQRISINDDGRRPEQAERSSGN
jgi:hypothetical protein